MSTGREPAMGFAWPRVRTATALGIVLILLGAPRVGWAEASLSQAEQAYAEIDFEGTIRHAQAALAEGNLTPQQVARVYQLMGISATALEQNEDARQYFIRLLALDPGAQRLESELSPNQRDTLMEARGFWASHRSRLDVEVDLIARRGSLRIRLSDPADMVHTIEVQSRIAGDDNYTRSSLERSEISYIQVEGADADSQVEYTLSLLDEYGNRLVQFGEEEVPLTVGTSRGSSSTVENGTSGTVGEPEVARSRTWVWVVVGVVAAAAVGGGIAAGVILYQQSQTVSVSSGVEVGF